MFGASGPLHVIVVAAIGCLVGALTVCTGVGTGSLTTPLLVALAGVRADVAIGSDLLFALATKIFAVGAHAQRRTIDMRLLFRLAPGGIVGAIAGIALTFYLHGHVATPTLNHALRIALGIALIVSATALLVPRLKSAPAFDQTSIPLPMWRLAVVGFAVGLMVSVTSIGAGSLTLPLLLLVVPRLALGRLVGTDLAFATILLVPALAGHLALGMVDVGLGMLLIAGSLVGVGIGTLLLGRISEEMYRRGLAGAVGLVAVTMLR